MILSELKSYLSEHRRVAMADLAARFGTEPEALRGMLRQWVARGRVRRLDGDASCGPCSKCADGSLEIYEWVD